jgi:hypothetical protein
MCIGKMGWLLPSNLFCFVFYLGWTSPVAITESYPNSTDGMQPVDWIHRIMINPIDYMIHRANRDHDNDA